MADTKPFKPKRVLFVCMGNICRSPAAEGVLRAFIEKKGLEGALGVSSAGTIGYHSGELPDSRMRMAADRRGYELKSRARQITAKDLQDSDFIIVMDDRNLQDLHRIDPHETYRHKIFHMREFLKNQSHEEVPDPYYGGPKDFETVLDLLEGSAENILRFVLKGETV